MEIPVRNCSNCGAEVDQFEPKRDVIEMIRNDVENHGLVIKTNIQNDGKLFIALSDNTSAEANSLHQSIANRELVEKVKLVAGGVAVRPSLYEDECDFCGSTEIVDVTSSGDSAVDSMVDNYRAVIKQLCTMVDAVDVSHVKMVADGWEHSEAFIEDLEEIEKVNNAIDTNDSVSDVISRNTVNFNEGEEVSLATNGVNDEFSVPEWMESYEEDELDEDNHRHEGVADDEYYTLKNAFNQS